MFGCHIPASADVELCNILEPPEAGSRIFANTRDSVIEKEIRYLAFAQEPSRLAWRPFPDSLLPTTNFPGTQSDEP